MLLLFHRVDGLSGSTLAPLVAVQISLVILEEAGLGTLTQHVAALAFLVWLSRLHFAQHLEDLPRLLADLIGATVQPGLHEAVIRLLPLVRETASTTSSRSRLIALALRFAAALAPGDPAPRVLTVSALSGVPQTAHRVSSFSWYRAVLVLANQPMQLVEDVLALLEHRVRPLGLGEHGAPLLARVLLALRVVVDALLALDGAQLADALRIGVVKDAHWLLGDAVGLSLVERRVVRAPV